MPAIRRGFSLIEVMIVIAVIAMLMAVAAPQFSASMRKGKERTLRSDLALVRAALAAFYSDAGCLPAELHELTRGTPPSGCLGTDSSPKSLPGGSFKGPYLPFVPDDAVSGLSLSYIKSAGSMPVVRSSASGNDSGGISFASY